MLLWVSVCESCHCYLTLLSGTPSKYQLCTSYMPQSLEYLTETSIFCSFAITALLRLSLFPDLISDSAGVCHFQAFPPFYLLFILGVFSPPLLSMLLLHPPSFSPSLTFVSTILWFVFSHSHWSLSIPVDDQWISVVSISVQHVALTQARGVGAVHLSDQCFPCCHLLAQLHLIISPPITAVCTAQGQAASELHWLSLCCFMKHKSPLPCSLHLFPWWHPCPYPVLAVLSHLCELLCVCFLSAGFSVLQEFTQSYVVRDLFSRALKFTST